MTEKTTIVNVESLLEDKSCIGQGPVPVLKAAAKWARDNNATLAAVIVLSNDNVMRFLSENHGEDSLFAELSLMIDDVKNAIRARSEEQ